MNSKLDNGELVSEEYQYLNLIKNILEKGFWEEGRNGKTKSIFGASMRFSLKDGKIPILTTKKTAWKTCLKELLWFIKGETDNKILKEQGVHIWNANTSREFLNSRGLDHYPEDMAGCIYGYQWRYFNANYNCFTGKRLLDNDQNDIHKDTKIFKGIDQLQQIIDALSLKNNNLDRSTKSQLNDYEEDLTKNSNLQATNQVNSEHSENFNNNDPLAYENDHLSYL